MERFCRNLLFLSMVLTCVGASAALVLQSNVSTDVRAMAAVYKAAVSDDEKGARISLLRDRYLTRGINVKDPTLVEIDLNRTVFEDGVGCPEYRRLWNKNVHELNFENKSDDLVALWELAQWGSNANLEVRHGFREKSGVYTWENPYKKLTLAEVDTNQRFVSLAVFGDRENERREEQLANPCNEVTTPSFIIEQNLELNDKPSLAQMDALQLTFVARLLQSSLLFKHADDWDRESETARFEVLMDIENVRADNDRELGYDQSFTVGLVFYDARGDNELYGYQENVAENSNRLVVYIPLDELAPELREDLALGRWAGFRDVNILPYVEKALFRAVARSAGDASLETLISSDLSDYFVTNVRYGWRVSSPHTVELQVSDVGLYAVPSSEGGALKRQTKNFNGFW